MPPVATPTRLLRVLHLDEDPMDQALVAHCLRRGPGSFTSRHVGNLAELERELAVQAADLVLLDPKLGPFHDLEAVAQVTRLAPGVPVVVLTGLPGAALGSRAIALGAEEFLSKDHLEPSRLASALMHAHARCSTRTPPSAAREPARVAPWSAAPSAPQPLPPGAVVDRYEIEAEVGQGGMATVYRVRHRGLGSWHALKVVRPEAAVVRERILQEARVQALFCHPHLVRATDLLELGDGGLGLVMDLVTGPTLQSWLQGPVVRGATWLSLFRGIVRGVRCAHQAGIVHRDLKPGNVLLQPSAHGLVPMVTDFGIAKILGGSPSSAEPHTKQGVTMGTPGYMAPEQIVDAATVDERADLFSLGCVLYRMISGRRPFPGKRRMAQLRSMIEGRVIPIRSRVPHVDEALVAVLDGLLQVEPEDRLPSCQALLEALDRVDGATLHDRIPVAVPRTAPSTQRASRPAHERGDPPGLVFPGV